MSQLLPEGGFRYLLDIDCWDAQRIRDLARHDHAGYVQGFPSGGLGDPHELYAPLITAVSPHKIQKLSPPPSLLIMAKKVLDIFSIFA